MDEGPEKRAAVPRRRVLKALALVPAAAAGCAGAHAEGAARTDGAAAQRRGDARSPAGPAVAAIRAHPVPAEAEPAFVFRAAAARPGDPR
jgi:hypothetical protein